MLSQGEASFWTGGVCLPGQGNTGCILLDIEDLCESRYLKYTYVGGYRGSW